MKKLMAVLLCLGLLMPSAGFAGSDSFTGSDVLKKGDKGPSVRLLQQSLKMAGHFQSVETSENFGDVTEKALKSYQAAAGLEADGVAGKATLTALTAGGFVPALPAAVYKSGNVYPELPALQAALHSEGLFEGPFSPQFGPATLGAVKAFQTKYALTADGVVGKGTLQQLRGLGYIYDPMELETQLEGEPETLQTVPEVTRGTGRGGIPINWYDIKPRFTAGKTVLTVEDYRTGVKFNVQVSYCATVHADIEPMTQQDTETVKKLWGGYSWDRRPVLIHFEGQVYAASMNGMPHAGLEAEPEGVTVGGRSGGFGRGYNFDDIKGNGMDGHLCLHFVGSRTHGTNKIDDKHQANIRIAAGQ